MVVLEFNFIHINYPQGQLGWGVYVGHESEWSFNERPLCSDTSKAFIIITIEKYKKK